MAASVKPLTDATSRQQFTEKVLQDLDALQQMLNADVFEAAPLRIGAEQEINFVGDDMEPARVGPEVLAELRKHSKSPELYTSEYARFNLEVKAEPLVLGNNCFRCLHQQLQDRLREVQHIAQRHDAQAVLAGILPTIRRSHLDHEALTRSRAIKRCSIWFSNYVATLTNSIFAAWMNSLPATTR